MLEYIHCNYNIKAFIDVSKVSVPVRNFNIHTKFITSMISKFLINIDTLHICITFVLQYPEKAPRSTTNLQYFCRNIFRTK